MAKLRDGRAEAARRRPQGAPRRFARAEKSRNPMQIIKSMRLGGDLLQARLRRAFAPIEWQEWAMGRPQDRVRRRAGRGRSGGDGKAWPLSLRIGRREPNLGDPFPRQAKSPRRRADAPTRPLGRLSESTALFSVLACASFAL